MIHGECRQPRVVHIIAAEAVVCDETGEKFIVRGGGIEPADTGIPPQILVPESHHFVHRNKLEFAQRRNSQKGNFDQFTETDFVSPGGRLKEPLVTGRVSHRPLAERMDQDIRVWQKERHQEASGR